MKWWVSRKGRCATYHPIPCEKRAMRPNGGRGVLNTARTNTFRVRKVDWEDTGGVWARCFHIPEVVPPPKADVHLLPRRKGEYACQEQHCRHRYSLGVWLPGTSFFNVVIFTIVLLPHRHYPARDDGKDDVHRRLVLIASLLRVPLIY